MLVYADRMVRLYQINHFDPDGCWCIGLLCIIINFLDWQLKSTCVLETKKLIDILCKIGTDTTTCQSDSKNVSLVVMPTLPYWLSNLTYLVIWMLFFICISNYKQVYNAYLQIANSVYFCETSHSSFFHFICWTVYECKNHDAWNYVQSQIFLFFSGIFCIRYWEDWSTYTLLMYYTEISNPAIY